MNITAFAALRPSSSLLVSSSAQCPSLLSNCLRPELACAVDFCLEEARRGAVGQQLGNNDVDFATG